MKLEVAYYNEKLSVWESLVEPVVENGKMKKWDLGLQVGGMFVGYRKEECV